MMSGACVGQHVMLRKTLYGKDNRIPAGHAAIVESIERDGKIKLLVFEGHWDEPDIYALISPDKFDAACRVMN
jgi:hypothetical protein